MNKTNNKDRISTTLVGEEARLLEELRNTYGTTPDGKQMSTAKFIGRCMKATIQVREKTRMAWSEAMAGLTSAMRELGVEEPVLDVIGWSNGLVQGMLSGNVPPSIANQMTAMADDWIASAIRDRIKDVM